MPVCESLFTLEGSIINTGNGNSQMHLEVDMHDMMGFLHSDYMTMFEFEIQNTGNVPVMFLGFGCAEQDAISYHPNFSIFVRRDNVWFSATGFAPVQQAELFGVIEPGEIVAGHAMFGDGIFEIGASYHYHWINNTLNPGIFESFNFTGELRYEQAR